MVQCKHLHLYFSSEPGCKLVLLDSFFRWLSRCKLAFHIEQSFHIYVIA